MQISRLNWNRSGTCSAAQAACLDEMAAVMDPDFVAELLDDFCTEGGVYAAQIATALKDGNDESLRMSAHSLKSMGRSLGFFELGDACEELEMMARGKERLGRPEAKLAVVRRGLEQGRVVREEWVKAAASS